MSVTWGRRTFREAGGVNPTRAAGPAGRYLSWSEREEIAALAHAGHGVREIARRLGRDPATISRELGRGATTRGYRASVGQVKADKSRAAPRAAKLATNLPLRAEVQARLRRRDSPEQIAGRLKIDFPDEPEMWVSPETIYQSLYVQARGGLKRELTAYLRTGRSMRKPRRREAERRGRIPEMVLDQRAPARGRGPGRARALGGRPDHGIDRVELRGRHPGRTHHRVRDAAAPARRPRRARGPGGTGRQDGDPARAAAAVPDLGPGQRDGQPRPDRRGHRPGDLLLRPPLTLAARLATRTPTACCASTCPRAATCPSTGPDMLDNIAAELNSRPRKRHGFQTPAEVLDRLLSEATDNHGVA